MRWKIIFLRWNNFLVIRNGIELMEIFFCTRWHLEGGDAKRKNWKGMGIEKMWKGQRLHILRFIIRNIKIDDKINTKKNFGKRTKGRKRLWRIFGEGQWEQIGHINLAYELYGVVVISNFDRTLKIKLLFMPIIIINFFVYSL